MRSLIFSTICFCIFCIHKNAFGQANENEWSKALASREVTLNVSWFNIEPFIYSKEDSIQGIEHDIIEAFANFLHEKYGIAVKINWIEEINFGTVYNKIRQGTNPNAFGVSAFSITKERMKEVAFTPHYLPDITVIISSNNVPIAQTDEDFIRMIPSLTAVTTTHTVFEDALREIESSYNQKIDLEYLSHYDDILTFINTHDNYFGYVDFPIYIIALNKGFRIKRQNVLSFEREGYGIIFPKRRGWEKPANEFFNDAQTKNIIDKILKKYLDKEVLNTINQIASQKPSEKNVYVLTKEKEILNKELIESARRMEEAQHFRNYLLIGIAVTLIFAVLLVWYLIRNASYNRILVSKNAEIVQKSKKIEEQLEQLSVVNEKLHSLNETKNNLIRVVAHDLKSPLNQIKGLIDVYKLTSKNIDEDDARLLEMIEQAIARQRNMISKILNVQVIESQEIYVNLEEIDINEVLYEVVESYAAAATMKGIKIYSRLDDLESHVNVLVDKDLIIQVIDNLVSNAIKFSDPGSTVWIKTQNLQQSVLIHVKDHGPGFTVEDMKSLFTKHAKLSAKPTGNEVSNGLGLFIVKKYVDKMEGKVWCESSPGEGTTFYLEFRKNLKPATTDLNAATAHH